MYKKSKKDVLICSVGVSECAEFKCPRPPIKEEMDSMEGEHHATECESEKPSSAVCGAFAAVVYDEKVKERLTQWIKL